MSPEQVLSAAVTRRAITRTGLGAGVVAAVNALGITEAAAKDKTRRAPLLPRRTGGHGGTQAIAATPSATPAPLDPASHAFMLHLLRRATYSGPTPEAIEEVTQAGGALRWLDRQLTPDHQADADLDGYLYRFCPLAHATGGDINAQVKPGGWAAMEDLVRWTTGKRIWSSNPLFEMLVEFFSDHLHITTPSSEPWDTRSSFDRDVVRRHAFGRFDDMLAASTTHPAMLHYLTNVSSSKAAPNENLARELLELHSVGRDAGYGQDGVTNCARALTGLSVWTRWNGGTAQNYGTLRYRADWHWVGRLKVLDWSDPNAAAADGVAVVESLARHLARHPATANRLAHKLAVRFVADDPPRDLVNRLSSTYLRNNTAIVPVLRALFTSSEFAASAGGKYRRPFEDAAATLRALGLRPVLEVKATNRSAVYDWRRVVGDCGHAPFGWPDPDGFPDTAAAWLGTGQMVGRWNFHFAATAGAWRDSVAHPALFDRMLGGRTPSSRSALIRLLTEQLLPGLNVPADHTNALIAFLGGDGDVSKADVTWRLEPLVALVLHSPLWSNR